MPKEMIVEVPGPSESLTTSSVSRAETCQIHDFSSVRWAWAGRNLAAAGAGTGYQLLLEAPEPRPADVALVRVERVGYHRYLETEQERRLRLYEGDRLVAVFGNRYATDVYEGRVLGLKRLHLLAASGLIGSVVTRHRDVGRPTALSFIGYLGDSSGVRLNLKQLRFRPVPDCVPYLPVVLVVGTGMNSGKTTVIRKILRGLTESGVPVAGCKLTGTASPRDLYEMRSAGAVLATDFSDYGFPSTNREPLRELLWLLDSMADASHRAGAQLMLAEVADGVLQPETQMLLESETVRRRAAGVVVAGACSASLLLAADAVGRAGLDVWAGSGLVTNSPLFSREFTSRSSVPLASSRGRGSRLVRIVRERLARSGYFPKESGPRDK